LIEWKPLTQQSRVEIAETFTKIFKDVEDVHEILNVGDDTSKEGQGDLKTGDDVPIHGIGGGDSFLKTLLGTPWKKKGTRRGTQTPRWGVLNLTWQNFMTIFLLLKATCQAQ